MKPKVFHLLDDCNVGGVTSTINSLFNSRLCKEFDFKLVSLNTDIAMLRTEHPDIVVVHNPSSWRRSLQLIQIKKYAGKVVIHEHHYSAGFEKHNVPNLSRFRAMLKWSYYLADQVVAISQAQSDWMRQNHLVLPQKLILIQQCRVLDAFLNIPVQVIQPPLILAAYGRFCRQKGIDLLLQATQQLADVDFQLHVGGYGEDEANLRRLAQTQKNIKFWGALQDVPAFLAAADIVIIPSRWEPWGNVCIEAKAAGKPLVVADVDGLSEQIQECGILVPPDSPEQLAHAIRRVAAVPSQTLESWGILGRESVRDAWGIYIEAWESLLRKMLND
jgi:glycosyltransferase involved in cell wall biosynthesis